MSKKKKTETANSYLEVIKNRTDLLKQLTKDFFRYSVILTPEDDIKLEPIILNNLLEESIASFYTVLKENKIVPKISIPHKKVVRNFRSFFFIKSIFKFIK